LRFAPGSSPDLSRLSNFKKRTPRKFTVQRIVKRLALETEKSSTSYPGQDAGQQKERERVFEVNVIDEDTLVCHAANAT